MYRGYQACSVNEKGHLTIGGCDAVDLAHEFGTPLLVIDETSLRGRMREFREALSEYHGDSMVLYASKSFMTQAVCRIADEEGLGLDVVSGGEIYTAVKAGFPMGRVYFHGNNKSVEEIEMALKAGVGRFVVDNFYEMDLLSRAARRREMEAKVLLRITPGIEAHTHDYIKTGQIDSKFGFVLENGQAMEAVEAALKAENLHLVGVHCHIGSQIFETEPLAEAARRLVGFMADVRDRSGHVLEELDLGGGFGVVYVPEDSPPAVAEYIEALSAALTETADGRGFPHPRLLLEPGRSIVSEAGVTLYRVGAIKEIPSVRTYLAVDGGMGDNPRPALYGARYQAAIAQRAQAPGNRTVSVAGKCCESGDMLIWDVELADPREGDVLAVFCTGAYTYSMASNYNRLPRPAVVLVRDGEVDLIVRRETYEYLTANDVIPERLNSARDERAASR